MKNYVRIMISAAFAILAASVTAPAQGPCKDPGSIRSVTKARERNFETVTFLVNDGNPDVTVSDVQPPFEDYGGKHLRIPGKAWKEVLLRGIFWTCTIDQNFRAKTTTIAGIKQTEQFEGQASYVIGYSSKKKYVGQTNTIFGKTRKIVISFRH